MRIAESRLRGLFAAHRDWFGPLRAVDPRRLHPTAASEPAPHANQAEIARVPILSSRSGTSRRDRRVISTACFITTGVFLADLDLPLGIAVPALYGIVVLLGLFVSNPRYPVAAASVVTVLTLIDALSPQVGVVTYGIVNRALVLVGIWVSAWLVARYAVVDRALDRSLKELHEQAALARLGEMTAVVAHEVRNPLAGIRGALQVISGRVADSRDRAVINDIVARLDGLDDIVEDLLVFARPREPKLSRVALVDLLESTAAALKRDPAHTNLAVVVSGDRAIIDADANQLHMVLLNLLMNAAQATGENGQIRVSATVEYEVCRIAIADNGPGIPAEIRPRIMEPFFTTKHRGTGLGLPTAKRVVERHRGTLAFECPPGGGTIVTITLPIDPRQHQIPRRDPAGA